MNNTLVDASNLKLAELHYYDQEHQGIELTDCLSYIILSKSDDGYVNLLNVEESYPVFKRLPYTNITRGGEEYGTKVSLVTDYDKCVSGPCWILKDVNLEESFPKNVNLESIEDYVLESDYFFKDRVDIAKKRMKKFDNPIKMGLIIKKDMKKVDDVDAFFKEREQGIQKKNKKIW